jgi:mono/diheme cytochrome c family protein
MLSRVLTLFAVLIACLGLSVGLAACGGDDEQKTGTIALTDLPSDPEETAVSSGSGAAGGDAASEPAGSDDATAGSDDSGSSGGDDAASSGDDAGSADGDDAAAGGDDAAAGGSGADVAEGKAIFTQSCAGCHTLADAGATGSVGPNLDDARPAEAVVAAKVRAGGGGMPSFDGTLAPEQITAVAAHVAGSAGS